MFLAGFVSIYICSAKGSVRTNMIIEISAPHEAVEHQLHHTIKEEPMKTETHHQEEITKPENSPGSQPPPAKKKTTTLPDSAVIPLGVVFTERPEDLGAFLSTAETHRFHFSCLRGANFETTVLEGDFSVFWRYRWWFRNPKQTPGMYKTP